MSDSTAITAAVDIEIADPTSEKPLKAEEAEQLLKESADEVGKEEEPVVETKQEQEEPAAATKQDQDDVSKATNTEDGRPFKKRRVGQDSQSRFDPSVLGETNDPEEIRKQVEFYFSDANLPTDNFLFTQVGGSENKPIPIKVIHSFKRMRRFQPYSAVVAALKESTFLDVTDKEEIRRKVALDPSIGKSTVDNVQIVEDKAQPRSIYVKGFGKEEPSTQFDIEAFFMPYGPINAVRLRRSHPDKNFKGSVFVEFDNEKTQEAFLALETKPQWKGQTLQIMSKKEYVEKKAQDIRDGKIQPNEPRSEYHGNSRGRGRGGARGRGRGGRNNGGRDRRDRDRNGDGDRDRNDWKGRRNDFQKNGFKDKYEGGRAKDEPKNGDQNSSNQDAVPKTRYDDRGVPIVETGSNSKVSAGADSAVLVNDGSKPESKKRDREDLDADVGAGDTKKSKVDEAPVAS